MSAYNDSIQANLFQASELMSDSEDWETQMPSEERAIIAQQALAHLKMAEIKMAWNDRAKRVGDLTEFPWI